jgi:hypothetical protein
MNQYVMKPKSDTATSNYQKGMSALHQRAMFLESEKIAWTERAETAEKAAKALETELAVERQRPTLQDIATAAMVISGVDDSARPTSIKEEHPSSP